VPKGAAGPWRAIAAAIRSWARPAASTLAEFITRQPYRIRSETVGREPPPRGCVERTVVVSRPCRIARRASPRQPHHLGGAGYWAAMSEENVERLRRLYRTRTFEEFAESLHPDAEMHQAREVPDADDYFGRQEFVRGTRRWLEEWDDFRFLVESATDLGERVLMRVRVSGRARASGVPLDRTVFHLWTFRDAMPWRLRVFFSEAPAFEAAGLSE